MKIMIFLYTMIDLDKATPNIFLDSHPNFVKNWDGWKVFILFFLLF